MSLEQHIVKGLCSLKKNVVLINLPLDYPVALWLDNLSLGLHFFFFVFIFGPLKEGLNTYQI